MTVILFIIKLLLYEEIFDEEGVILIFTLQTIKIHYLIATIIINIFFRFAKISIKFLSIHLPLISAKS